MERKIIGFHEIERRGRGGGGGTRVQRPFLFCHSLAEGGLGSGVSRSPVESNRMGSIARKKGEVGMGGMGTMPERGPTTLFSPVIVSVRLRFMRNLLPTSRRASLGHSWNQSMVVQLIRAGYWRNLFLNASPIGLRHRIRCILARALSINSA